MEMQKKDEDFRKQTTLKEKEFQKHLESMLKGKMNEQYQDLQKKIVDKDCALEALHQEIAMTQQVE